MKTMWKKAMGMLCVGGAAVMCLAGCGTDSSDSFRIPTQEIRQDKVDDKGQNAPQGNANDNAHNAPQNNADDKAQGNGDFYDGANLYGDVVEFSDEGFSLSPATIEKVEGGGEVLEQAAPGFEDDENNMQITYTDNTVFQIVNLSMSSQSEVSREDTDKESVKKQSSVAVFGSCQDTYHWTADKILIFRWQ